MILSLILLGIVDLIRVILTPWPRVDITETYFQDALFAFIDAWQNLQTIVHMSSVLESIFDVVLIMIGIKILIYTWQIMRLVYALFRGGSQR